jgi:hypothetical protein
VVTVDISDQSVDRPDGPGQTKGQIRIEGLVLSEPTMRDGQTYMDNHLNKVKISITKINNLNLNDIYKVHVK